MSVSVTRLIVRTPNLSVRSLPNRFGWYSVTVIDISMAHNPYPNLGPTLFYRTGGFLLFRVVRLLLVDSVCFRLQNKSQTVSQQLLHQQHPARAMCLCQSVSVRGMCLCQSGVCVCVSLSVSGLCLCQSGVCVCVSLCQSGICVCVSLCQSGVRVCVSLCQSIVCVFVSQGYVSVSVSQG